MPNQKLQAAVDELSQYFSLATREDLVQELLTPATSAPTTTRSPAGTMAHLLVSTAEGSFTTKQVVDQFNDYIGKDASARSIIDDSITIISDAASNFTLKGADPSMSSIVGPDGAQGLSAFIMKKVNLIPAGRDVNAVSLFMNSIPTLEMSRCVPYLNIEVKTGRPPTDAGGRIQGMSLMRFLNGSSQVDATSADGIMSNGIGGPIDPNTNRSDSTTSGMELFTSPQVLTDPSPELDVGRASPVLDKFRPLMSIERFVVEITPQVGFFAYGSAEMDIVLHDRSRLVEIADFVQPDMYKNTELNVEYGWSHPDTSGDNVFGTLINAMRAKEKYGVYNSSFTFTRTGEVKVKLKLAAKGATDIRILKIGDGKGLIEAGKAIKEMQERIGELRTRLNNRLPGIPELRGEQQLFSAAEDLSSTLSLTPEQVKQLRTFRSSLGKSNSADYKELLSKFTALLGTNGNNGEAAKFKHNIATAINSVVDKFPLNEDPFLDTKNKDITFKNKKSLTHVSLGKLLLAFVGVPISGEQKYSDVQLFFYPFNANAGRMRGNNIASFAIPLKGKGSIREALTDIATARRGVNISLRDFITYVANNYIDDMASTNYGLKDFYISKYDPATGVRTAAIAQKKGQTTTQLNSRLEQRLKQIGLPDGIFKMPQVDFIIETVPGAVLSDNESARAANDRTILRIHIFDKLATAYEALGQLLLASRTNDLRTLGNLASDAEHGDPADHEKMYNKFLQAAVSAGLIEKESPEDPTSKVYVPTGKITGLRDFLRTNVPTILFGGNATNIKDGTFATIQDALQAANNMIRAGETGEMTPTGLTQGNLPLRVMPARATIVSAGCPLIHYMQQFFIDFNTNTTVDNIYGVNKLTHEISPGKFESKWDLVPCDAYGSYTTLLSQVSSAKTALDHIKNNQKRNKPAPTVKSSKPRPRPRPSG